MHVPEIGKAWMKMTKINHYPKHEKCSRSYLSGMRLGYPETEILLLVEWWPSDRVCRRTVSKVGVSIIYIEVQAGILNERIDFSV